MRFGVDMKIEKALKNYKRGTRVEASRAGKGTITGSALKDKVIQGNRRTILNVMVQWDSEMEYTVPAEELNIIND